VFFYYHYYYKYLQNVHKQVVAMLNKLINTNNMILIDQLQMLPVNKTIQYFEKIVDLIIKKVVN